MAVFAKYALFYDSLYQDKDHNAECDFLEEIFNRYAPGRVMSILDLGCGTGRHALILAQRGHSVFGVDRSREMLDIARAKEGTDKVTFRQGDIRNLCLERTFDVVISMFAVMSYMTTNDDLSKAFHTARLHLEPGGLFVFDSWFGPGVFHEPPTVRQKELINKEKLIIKRATPTFDPIEQVADVQFDVLEMRGDKKIVEVTEHHLMRPFFVQEIKQFAILNDLELVSVCPWMDIDRELELVDWLACFALRAI